MQAVDARVYTRPVAGWMSGQGMAFAGCDTSGVPVQLERDSNQLFVVELQESSHGKEKDRETSDLQHRAEGRNPEATPRRQGPCL